MLAAIRGADRQVSDNLHAAFSKQCRRADAGALQNDGRVNGTGRENDERRKECLRLTIDDGAHPRRPAAIKNDLVDGR